MYKYLKLLEILLITRKGVDSIYQSSIKQETTALEHQNVLTFLIILGITARQLFRAKKRYSSSRY
jgi:hypothetical protein